MKRLIIYLEEATNDNSEPPRERPRLQLQPRTKPLETTQTLSESASSENNMASNVADSSTDHDQEMSQALKQRNDNMSSNQSQPDSEHTDSVENTAGTGDDSSITKQTRGAGSSIFGGAKPVDTAAKEMEIERRLKELQMSTSETKDDEEEKSSAPRSVLLNRLSFSFYIYFHFLVSRTIELVTVINIAVSVHHTTTNTKLVNVIAGKMVITLLNRQ